MEISQLESKLDGARSARDAAGAALNQSRASGDRRGRGLAASSSFDSLAKSRPGTAGGMPLTPSRGGAGVGRNLLVSPRSPTARGLAARSPRQKTVGDVENEVGSLQILFSSIKVLVITTTPAHRLTGSPTHRPAAHRPTARQPTYRPSPADSLPTPPHQVVMKALAEDEDELCNWFESRVEQVLSAVQAHQQMVRDMERREEVAIEKDEMNATRRRLLDDDGASVGGASRDSLADASAHSGRTGRSGGGAGGTGGGGAEGEANVRASIDELAATIKALDVQIRERRRGRRGGGGSADDGLSVDGRGSVGSLASLGSAGSAESREASRDARQGGGSQGQHREKSARRQSRLREELKGLEGQRQRALDEKQQLEERVRVERGKQATPSESHRKSQWESQRREDLAEIDDKIEALQTEIDYKDAEIRKNKDNLNQVSDEPTMTLRMRARIAQESVRPHASNHATKC